MRTIILDALVETPRSDKARALKGTKVWCYSEIGGNVNYGVYCHEYMNSFGVDTAHRKEGKLPKSYRFISTGKPSWIP